MSESNFLNAKNEFLESIKRVSDNPTYREHHILERIVEPDRIISFDVKWKDDNGKEHINKGYRIQFNNVNGPYKGGLRFHPTVNTDILSFLAFEQIFKNVLTGLPMGGGKGGSDFDPKGKSDSEIKNFCEAFMKELYPHIGVDKDVPAGDIGVGGREIRFLYEAYKKYSGKSDCSLTGKPLDLGGSLCRPEATGYGLCYFVEAMLAKYYDTTFAGKTVIISGSGNVAIYACEKCQQLGAKVVAMSDSNNTVYDPDGIDLALVKDIKEVKRGRIKEYCASKPNAKLLATKDIWSIKCDIALPCGTQNEIDLDDAKKLVANGVKVVAEGANKPTLPDAVKYFIANGVKFAPGKASNAGGVAVSGLEIIQNNNKESWSFEKVDNRLKDIMVTIFNNSYDAASKYSSPSNLVDGANIASFIMIADKMVARDKNK